MRYMLIFLRTKKITPFAIFLLQLALVRQVRVKILEREIIITDCQCQGVIEAIPYKNLLSLM